ncbi:MAG: RNA-splicing factor [Thelocarpon impressellum]|nr:MAG: RNA-splicing factor [Thelocarpon impressellum]
MSSNVGLTTPRGSGTSGYVQRNLSNLRPRDNAAPYPRDLDGVRHRQRQPDKDILEHDRKRAVEVKVFELQDRLEDEGVDEDEIETQTSALRKKLLEDGKGGATNARDLKPHQVHELAKAKIEESEKLRRALGISADYEEGGHWRKQEERQREATLERGKEDARRDSDGAR